jgi:hypothetical protein
MQSIHFWEVNSHLATQEIPCLSSNPTDQYHLYISLTLAAVQVVCSLQVFEYISHISQAYYTSHLIHPPWLDHLCILQTVSVTKLLIIHFSPFSCYFLPLGSKYSYQHAVFNPMFCAQTDKTKFCKHTKQGLKFYICKVLSFTRVT